MTTLKVFRAISGNSYILIKVEKEIAYINFPFLNIKGISGSLPLQNQIKDTFLGEVLLNEDKSVNFDSLLKITGGY